MENKHQFSKCKIWTKIKMLLMTFNLHIHSFSFCLFDSFPPARSIHSAIFICLSSVFSFFFFFVAYSVELYVSSHLMSVILGVISFDNICDFLFVIGVRNRNSLKTISFVRWRCPSHRFRSALPIK